NSRVDRPLRGAVVNDWTDFGWYALGMLGGAVAGFVYKYVFQRRRRRTRSPQATRRGERHPPKLNNDGGRTEGSRVPGRAVWPGGARPRGIYWSRPPEFVYPKSSIDLRIMEN